MFKYQQRKQEKSEESLPVKSAEDVAADDAAKVAKKPKGIPTSWGKSVAEKWETLPDDHTHDVVDPRWSGLKSLLDGPSDFGNQSK